MATYNQSESYGINTKTQKYKLSTLFQRARRDRGFMLKTRKGGCGAESCRMGMASRGEGPGAASAGVSSATSIHAEPLERRVHVL